MLCPRLLTLLLAAATTAQAPTQSRWVGLTEPGRRATLAFAQDGRILEITAHEGERVREGQVLARLDARVQDLEVQRLRILAGSDQEVTRAELELEQAQREELRMAELLAQDIKAESELETCRLQTAIARTRLAIAQQEQRARGVQLELARELLEQRCLRSPLDGILVQRLIQPGETAERLTAVLEVHSIDPLRVEFACPVEQLALCRIGAPLMVRPGLGAGPRTGRVVLIGPHVDPASQTVRVRLLLPNGEQPWPAGLRVEVEPLPDAEPAPSGR